MGCITGQGNTDNMGGSIIFNYDSIILNGPLPIITVDSLAIHPSAAGPLHINANFSCSDPIFNFSASASHSCMSSDYIYIFNAIPVTYVVTNTNDSGPGSLRDAIERSNLSESFDFIRFNIPGPAPHVIHPLSGFDIRYGVTIDGSTQPANGYSGTAPKIELDGVNLSYVCFKFRPKFFLSRSSDATVYGLYIHRFSEAIHARYFNMVTIGSSTKRNILSGNGNAISLYDCFGSLITNNYLGIDSSGLIGEGNIEGITFDGIIGPNFIIRDNVISDNDFGLDGFGNGPQIFGNKIGTDASGSFAIGNKSYGLYLVNTVNSIIGSSNPLEGNLISGNNVSTTTIGLFSGDSCIIKGNKFGTNWNCTDTIPNSTAIQTQGKTQIGGLAINERNIISGNLKGIATARNVEILGNYIGTDCTGTISMANSLGIWISNFSGQSFVQKIHDNLISGNDVGIGTLFIQNHNVEIYRNLIGLDASGINALPNNYGIIIGSAYNFDIGGRDTTKRNYISGNIIAGIRLGWHSSSRDTVMNNILGLNKLMNPVPNGKGIFFEYDFDSAYIANNIIAANNTFGIEMAYESNNNTIENNIICNNVSDGIRCEGNENLFRKNSIFGNGNKGINLYGSGNDTILTPQLLSATSNNISGTALPGATVELFRWSSQDSLPQGKNYIASVIADSAGNWNYIGPITTWSDITATPTDSRNNTSEFAFRLPQLNLGRDTTLCAGNSYLLDAGSGFISYQWSTSDTSQSILVIHSGFYHVDVTLPDGSIQTDYVYVLFTPCMEVAEIFDNEVKIFPNPSLGEFVVDFSALKPVKGINNLFIEDLSGRLIYSKTIELPEKIILQLSAPENVYFLHLVDNYGVKTFSGKIILIK